MLPIEFCKRFQRDEDGVVAVIVSLMMTVLIGFVALGVDVASLYRDRAKLQSVSDLSAMSAAADTDAAQTRAMATITRNGRAEETLKTLQLGRYLRNPAIPRAKRFQPLDAEAPGINAAHVTLRDSSPLHFAQVFSGATRVALERSALSSRTGAASFSLDSHLAKLDAASLNALLTSEFGAGAQLSVADVTALADTQINLGALTETLNRVQDSGSANPAEILNATPSIDTLLNAVSAELPPSLATSLDRLASASSGQTIPVSAVVGGIDTDLGLTVTEFLDQMTLSALDLVKAAVGADGLDPAVTLDLGTNVEGILSTEVNLSAGEPPARSGWVALGEEGVQLNRAEARLSLDISADPGLLTGLGLNVLATRLDVPIHVELAGATATLEEISCGGSAPSDVAAAFSVSPTPLHSQNGTSVAALYLGKLPASTPIDPATLDFADLLTVRIEIPLLVTNLVLADLVIQGKAHTTVGTSAVDEIVFTRSDVSTGDTTRSFGSQEAVTSAVSALLSGDNTVLRIKPGQEGLISGVAAPVVNSLLSVLPAELFASLAAPVDGVIDSVLAAVGLKLGAGELTLTGHHCERLRLVQ
ncbi:MAG: pilus assembly protein TadG-related protein [Roseovarius sp.]|jgi:uncharacterized membrane protein|uniref:pilus assembly protein TadG-related protein n=1 Tax=Roseovarius sp. TaxID=1486281 RepID=UPI0032EBE48D